MNIPKILNYFQNNEIETDIYCTNNQFLGVWTLPKDIFVNIAKYIENARYEYIGCTIQTFQFSHSTITYHYYY